MQWLTWTLGCLALHTLHDALVNGLRLICCARRVHRRRKIRPRCQRNCFQMTLKTRRIHCCWGGPLRWIRKSLNPTNLMNPMSRMSRMIGHLTPSPNCPNCRNCQSCPDFPNSTKNCPCPTRHCCHYCRYCHCCRYCRYCHLRCQNRCLLRQNCQSHCCHRGVRRADRLERGCHGIRRIPRERSGHPARAH